MRVITIGRSAENDYVINDMGVSRFNTQIILSDDGAFSIIDMGSENGTYVNGTRISGECPLRPGDSVKIANIPVDWQALFSGEGPGVKYGKNNWVLSLILGIVSVALIIGVILVVLMFNRHKKSDNRTINELQEKTKEYQNTIKDSESDLDFLSLEADAYKGALEEAKAESDIAISKALENAENAQKFTREVEGKLMAAEKKNEELQKAVERAKNQMAQEIGDKDQELAAIQSKADSLEALLEAEKKKLQDMTQTVEKLDEFLEAIKYAPCEDVCRQLRYDFTGKKPKDVLIQKYKEGEGDMILAVIQRMRQQLQLDSEE